MLKKGLFRKPGNTLEKTQGGSILPVPNVPEQLFTTCKGCKAAVLTNELVQNLHVCPRCGYHGVIGARERLLKLADEHSFEEWDAAVSSADPLLFPGYLEKAAEALMAENGDQIPISRKTSAIWEIPEKSKER